MRIVGTEMTLASSHALSARREVTESLRAWVGPRRPDFEGRERTRAATACAGKIWRRSRGHRSFRRGGRE